MSTLYQSNWSEYSITLENVWRFRKEDTLYSNSNTCLNYTSGKCFKTLIIYVHANMLLICIVFVTNECMDIVLFQ